VLDVELKEQIERPWPGPGGGDQISELDQRIDIILFRGPDGAPELAQGKVFGDSQREKTSSGLWPSDDVAVLVRFLLPG